MEKIYIKPIAKEIIAKSGPADGHTDIFSYNSDQEEGTHKLGSMFVVAQVQHATDDVAYIVELIAGLAKREYYLHPALAPKEAFAGTLKKINEVVQDFFKNSELALNIGIFAVADDHIYISRLGKFKIVLARDDKNIDILNNIELFEKEHIQEKEFSNIISGKVLEGDRILAFYPGQPISSRERYIKSYFLKLTEVEFIHKINQLKTANESFSCALLYIKMHKLRQAAIAPQIQPQELQPTLARAPRPKAPQVAQLASNLSSDDTVPPPPPGFGEPRPAPMPPPPLPQTEVEMPRIIPSEFSLGQRNNPIITLLKKFSLPRLSSRNKMLFLAMSVLVIVGLTFSSKSLFFTDPEQKKLNTVLDQAEKNIKLAKTKINQNEAAGARDLLLISLATISENSGTETSRSTELQDELFSLLDAIDQVQEAAPVLVLQLPEDLGKANLLAASGNEILVYSAKDETGFLTTVASGSTDNIVEVKNLRPNSMFAGANGPVLVEMAGKKVGYFKKGTFTTAELQISTEMITADLYQENLYVLTTDSIQKVTDAAKGGVKSALWLKEGAPAAEGFRIAIDGGVYVLSKPGTITYYFKGARSDEFRTGLLPGPETLLLTNPNSPHLYLVEKSLNRIYVVDKKSGALVRAHKIGSLEPILAAALGPNETIHFVTADNKIWKLQ